VTDETVGSMLFDVNEIIETKDDPKINGKFGWKNIYGSPMGLSDSEAKRAMNDNPEKASFWKGRILMQVCVEETEKPVAKVAQIDDEIVM